MRCHSRSNRGFTIIEIIVVITTIAILLTLTILGANTYIARSNDSERKAKATIVAEALEKYYDTNGEYPSPLAVTNLSPFNTKTTVATLLNIDPGTLSLPGASNTSTIPLAATQSTKNALIYEADTNDEDGECNTTPRDGCDHFTLSYEEEQSEALAVIESKRNRGGSITLESPDSPSIFLQANATNTSLTISTNIVTCPRGTPSYRIDSKTGPSDWNNGAWSSLRTLSIATSTGNIYTARVAVKCTLNEEISDISFSDESVHNTAIAAPAAPTTTLSGSTTVTATAGTVTCATGATRQYRIDNRTNDGAWTSGTWGTAATRSLTTQEGSKYGFRSSARCMVGTGYSSTSTGSEAAYIRPIATLTAPSASSNATNRSYSWTGGTCPSGTTRQFQYRFVSSTATGSWVATTAVTVTNSAATSQGINYRIDVQQRCQSSFATGTWSATGTSNFWVPVVHARVVQSALKAVVYVDPTWGAYWDTNARGQIKLKTYSITCASGLARESRAQMTWNTPGKNSWVQASTRQYSSTDGWFTASTNVVIDLRDEEYNGWAVEDEMIEAKVQTRCRNTTTNRATDASGATNLTQQHDPGNLRIRTGNRYNVECSNTVSSTYCSGGYNYLGAQTSTASSVTSCQARSLGIDPTGPNGATAYRYTPMRNLGQNPPCW